MPLLVSGLPGSAAGRCAFLLHPPRLPVQMDAAEADGRPTPPCSPPGRVAPLTPQSGQGSINTASVSQKGVLLASGCRPTTPHPRPRDRGGRSPPGKQGNGHAGWTGQEPLGKGSVGKGRKGAQRCAMLLKHMILFNPHNASPTRSISQMGKQRHREVTYSGSHSQQEAVPRFHQKITK